MKSKTFRWAARTIAVVVLAASTGALAQTPRHQSFRGVINDFTPASVGGPWEVRGHWSLVKKGESGKADFSAALTMERSDAGVAQSGGGNLNDPKARNAHTHHITLIDGEVTTIAGGFQVTAPATITANGSFPPPFGPNSTVTIAITGGNDVTFSNVAMTMGGEAAGHFGVAPLHGVVSTVHSPE